MLELWPEYNWDVKTSLNICFSWKCFADMYVGPLSTKCSVGERWYRCVLTTTCLKALLYHFCFSSLLTVANINTYESDGRQANTTAAMEQWSSASLPLTGGYMSIYRHAFSPVLSRTLKTVTYDCRLFLSEELCLELARAIEAGDTQAASQHASALARQKAVLTIQLSEKNYADGEIRWGLKSVGLSIQSRSQWPISPPDYSSHCNL